MKLLNSNSENPYLIWNNGTRAELLEFLEGQQEGNIKRVGIKYTYFFSFPSFIYLISLQMMQNK